MHIGVVRVIVEHAIDTKTGVLQRIRVIRAVCRALRDVVGIGRMRQFVHVSIRDRFPRIVHDSNGAWMRWCRACFRRGSRQSKLCSDCVDAYQSILLDRHMALRTMRAIGFKNKEAILGWRHARKVTCGLGYSKKYKQTRDVIEATLRHSVAPPIDLNMSNLAIGLNIVV